MDFSTLNALISGNIFYSIFAEYFIGKAADGIWTYIRNKYQQDSLEYQIIDSLNNALKETCIYMGGEYDEDAIFETFAVSLFNVKKITSQRALKNILESAIGQTVNEDILSIWLLNFQKELTKPERAWLFNFIGSHNVIKNDCFKTDNEKYAKVYNEPMFLHKDVEHPIKLCDIFVPHEVHQIKYSQRNVELPTNDILECIEYFVSATQNRYLDFMIIEADAGLGKSSLVSYLANLYINDYNGWVRSFGEFELICIRLRDIIPNNLSFSSDSINMDVLQYLNVDSIESFQKEHPKSIVILDGFDELCMVERINVNTHYYINELYRLFEECKLIITSRPNYIRVYGLNFPLTHIVLKHFEKSQREKWSEKYKKISCTTEEQLALEYIADIDDDDTSGICDTPMALYMITAGKINEDALNNHWVLYNQIFSKELSETQYNSVFSSKTGTYSHGIRKYSEIIYRIGAEIAYEMYKKGNKKLYLTEDEILKIIKNMNLDIDNIQGVIESCYALCSYWKSTGERGAVEFYHNNIRDFFVCEKIFYEFNNLYNECQKEDSYRAAEIIANGLYEKFHEAKINDKVIEFLYLRVLYEKENYTPTNFIKMEIEQKNVSELLYAIFNQINGTNDNSLGKSYVEMFTVILNMVRIYRYAYEPYLEKSNRLIKWKSRESMGEYDAMIKNNFKQIFIDSPLTIKDAPVYLASHSYFVDFDVSDGDLRYAGFCKSTIENCKMSNTILIGVDFSNSKICNTSFTNSNLEYASFLDCVLDGCDFTDANLTHTILPDGMSFDNSWEAETHLKELLESNDIDGIE